MKSIDIENYGTMYIGKAVEISRLYRHFKKRSIAHSAFCSSPKFNFMKYYGLVVNKYDLDGNEVADWSMQVVTGDTALAMIYDL